MTDNMNRTNLGCLAILALLAFGVVHGQTGLTAVPGGGSSVPFQAASSVLPNTAAVVPATQLTVPAAAVAASNTGLPPTAVMQPTDVTSTVKPTNQLPLTLMPTSPTNTMMLVETSPSTPQNTRNLPQTGPPTAPATGPLQPPTGPAATALPTTSRPTTTPAVQPPIHVQIVFVNSYNSTAGLWDGANITTYIDTMTSSIAAVCDVPTERITDVNVTSQPATGFLVARFTIQPQSSSCLQQQQLDQASCGVDLQQAFNLIKAPVNDGSLVIRDLYKNNLTVAVVNYNPQFTAWTDNGPCPVSSCKPGVAVCDCELTGTLYCRSLTSASSGSSGPHLLYLLLLLLLIPLVILVVLLVLCCRRKRRTRTEPLKKVNLRADMLTYKEYATRQHHVHQPQPTVATISSRYNNDTLFRSLGENVSIAFNSTTFIDPHDDRSSGASIISKNDDDAEC